MSKIISFRGLMGAATQDTLVLHTNDGSTGYRIVKFQVVAYQPAGGSPEAVIQIWKEEQTAISYNIDFSDNRLLGSAFYENNQNVGAEGTSVIIFDREIFNQDIYITCASTVGSINYYIELEAMDLALDESTVATLKDIRNSN